MERCSREGMNEKNNGGTGGSKEMLNGDVQIREREDIL